MLPSHTRLSRSQVANLLLNNDLKVVFNRVGTLKYANSLENNGFTVVTGSKHQKKAVLRNKVRRQLYTLFKQYKGFSAEAILYVSKQVYDMTYSELQQNLNALLEKAQKNT
ncbi:MAG: Ribonuclease [Candidatus Nomurabacteria bacterium]|nr:Ribonuclease [Candidatus Nomurabacteria bacterium]